MHASVNSEMNKELVFKIIKLKDFLKIKNKDQRNQFVIQLWCQDDGNGVFRGDSEYGCFRFNIG